MHAQGQLKHHFWGEYAASIVLLFGSAEHAAAAVLELPGWKPSEHNAAVLHYFGKGAELETTIDRLVTFGANRHAIDSVDHSIDYGDPFTVDVPRPPDADQLPLALEAGR